jgi:hypothetical protein
MIFQIESPALLNFGDLSPCSTLRPKIHFKSMDIALATLTRQWTNDFCVLPRSSHDQGDGWVTHKLLHLAF